LFIVYEPNDTENWRWVDGSWCPVETDALERGPQASKLDERTSCASRKPVKWKEKVIEC
jgi:hypothetical protein